MSKSISQREARALRKRVSELERVEEQRRSRYNREYPGTNIATITVGAETFARISTARLLDHAVVVTSRNDNELAFYALPHPKVPV